MIRAYQILAFYAFLGLVTTGLLGYYPKIEPLSFQGLSVFQNHPKFHVIFGFASVLALAISQVMGLIILLRHQSKIRDTSNQISQVGGRWIFPVGYVAMTLSLALIATIPYLGVLGLLQKLSPEQHFHFVLVSLGLLLPCLIGAGAVTEFLDRSYRQQRLKLGLIPPDPFIWDLHARRFSLGIKFLFLGINVWWPYLVLCYGLGLKLDPLAFLPIHLAGVLPFAYLKRLHKFKRTLHPDYIGSIKHRERYRKIRDLA
jgi:hypothetical protein